MRNDGEEHYPEPPEYGPCGGLEHGDPQDEVAHHDGVVCFWGALPAQYGGEEHQGGDDAGDDCDDEVGGVEGGGGGVELEEVLCAGQGDEEAKEGCNGQCSDHVCCEDQQSVERPGCAHGPVEVADESLHVIYVRPAVLGVLARLLNCEWKSGRQRCTGGCVWGDYV